MAGIGRRHILKALVGTAGLALLSACAGAPAPTPTPAPAQPTSTPAAQPKAAPTPTPAATTPQRPGRVKITYWGSFSANLGEAEREVVNRFNQSQNEVEVEYQFQGSYEETAQKLTAALQARTQPEVSLLSDVWWFKFYLNRALAPLNDFFRAHNVDKNDYVDPLINEGIRKGQIYWVPFARSTPIFYYNKAAWQEAGLPDRGPETWEEFKTWVPKLLKKDSSGKVTRYAFAHPGAASYIAWLFQCVVWQWGGAYSDPDFKIRIAEPPAVQAGEFYRSTTVEGWASTPQNIDNEFRGGIAAAIMGSTAGLAGHEKNAQFPVGTAFLPKGPAGFGCCTGGSGLAILAATPPDKQEAAFKYIKFATSTETTIFWSQNTGYMPVRKSAIESPAMQEFYKQRPNFQTAVRQLPLTRPQDAARVFIPNGDQIIGKGLERIVINKEPADTVFKDVAATLEKEARPVLRQLQAVEG